MTTNNICLPQPPRPVSPVIPDALRCGMLRQAGPVTARPEDRRLFLISIPESALGGEISHAPKEACHRRDSQRRQERAV